MYVFGIKQQDLALNNLRCLICDKTQPNLSRKENNIKMVT